MGDGFGGEARVDEEEIEVTAAFSRGGCNERATGIKTRIFTPGLDLDQRERLLRTLKGDDKLTVSTDEIFDRGDLDEFSQIDNGYTGTDLLHFSEQVA